MSAAEPLHDATRLHAKDEAAALEDLHRLGCTDGLPVVIPTPERVEQRVSEILAKFPPPSAPKS